jgi:hypothetical protein
LEYNLTASEAPRILEAGLAQVVERLENSVFASFVFDENRKDSMITIQF